MGARMLVALLLPAEGLRWARLSTGPFAHDLIQPHSREWGPNSHKGRQKPRSGPEASFQGQAGYQPPRSGHCGPGADL